MKGLLADADAGGHVAVLISACRGPTWGEIWQALALPVLSLAGVGLPADAPDSAVWAACQSRGLVLLTGNRNAVGADSLEATIRSRGTVASLPVITLADRDRLLRDRRYAERAAGRLIDFLMDIDRYRGTGRLYVP